MLESIRAGAQSFGVKVAFGIIILVFVFWGIGNFNDRDYSNVVAMVNGEPIVAAEFERAYMNAEEAIMRNNPGVTREQLAKDHLGRQVLRELIQALLLSQEAKRAGVAVSPLELHQAVAKIPAFQDETGKFDPEAYKRYLDNGRVSAAQYESGIRSELLRDKLLGLVTASAWVDPDEARNRFNYLREQRLVDYVFLPVTSFEDNVKIEDAEISSWYDAHKNNFSVPAMADISYIIVRPEALVDAEAIPEEDLRKWYDANREEFSHPEQVKARHILVEVEENADEEAQKAALAKLDEVKAALSSGKSFAEVADQFNSARAAGPGGELGFIERGQTVPPFEEAAFTALPGKITEPVRSPYGWHIILVEEKKEAGTAPFEEVKKDAQNALAHDMGLEKLSETLDNLIEDNILAKPLAESAAKFNLKDGRTGLMGMQDLADTLGIKPEDAKRLLETPAGAPLDTALDGGDQFVIARVEEIAPAKIKPLADVRDEVITSLKSEKALEKAMTAAAELLKKISANEKAALQEARLQLSTSQEIARGASLPGFNGNAQLSEAIFASEPGKWFANPFAMTGENGQGALLGKVNSVVIPDQQEFDSMAELLQRALKQERKEDIYNLFIQELADKAKIEVANQNIIDRVNM